MIPGDHLTTQQVLGSPTDGLHVIRASDRQREGGFPSGITP